ncbi:DUF3558 domain-containing protein [Tomitella biformata]|uniref:DUF3558 domain-containing protein n=1 Tax=Tomitella biformata TaxID=630403 RepID=UPI0004662642|nr:DUF3558 domain-containing protein [Tomitella biformata]
MTTRGSLGAGSAALALAMLPLVAGCVSASPTPDVNETAGPAHPRDFAKLLRECQVVEPLELADITGVPDLASTFSGAICRWNSTDGSAMVTLNWFEHGSMRVEKDTAERLGYEVENEKLGGSVVYVERDPNDQSSCGVTARASDQGIIGWWVQGSVADPCQAALDLAALSLNRAF